MLDKDTKARIDDCRDILVGKLPDPKSQIEQITIALIYKFMDDMDKEAIELGGKPKFFADYMEPNPEFPTDRGKDKLVEFSKFSWSHLFDSKVTSTNMLSLYGEALEKMEKNPNIPELFRNIFKNSYLPYRDPETLRMFLKTIGEFEYSHSEKLGDAFEYLLSIMGAQGDAGQFRTPRHIIDFIVELVGPEKDDKILDPACGTAGFLISAFKHIIEKNDEQLTPDEQKKLFQNFVGYDISPDMVRLSLVNMYLHGFSQPEIHEYDTLTSEERWNDSFDVVLANPPFMTPKGGIRPHKRFTVKANKSEVLFLDYIVEHLRGNCKSGIIIPEGVLHNGFASYKKLRSKIIEDNLLYAIIELPHGVFKPYASVKTHIILMDKSIAKIKDEILFVQIENDGYEQSGTRKKVDGSELSKAIEVVKDYKIGQIEKDYDIKYNLVSKKEILNDKFISLVGRRYKAVHYAEMSKFNVLKLDKNIIEVFKGKSGAQSTNKGEYPFIVSAANFKTADHYSFDCKAICIPIVSGTGHGHASVKRIHYVEGKFALANIMCGIKVKDESILNPKFLFTILQSMKDEILASLMTGTSNVSLNMDDLYEVEIPCPDIDYQNKFVENQNEIESNRKRKLEECKQHEIEMIENGKKIWE